VNWVHGKAVDGKSSKNKRRAYRRALSRRIALFALGNPVALYWDRNPRHTYAMSDVSCVLGDASSSIARIRNSFLSQFVRALEAEPHLNDAFRCGSTAPSYNLPRNPALMLGTGSWDSPVKEV